MKTEWVIHIWGKQRDKLELTPQEKFHIDMIKRCKYTTIFDKVLVNISMDDINDESLFSFLKVNLLDLFSGIKEIEIKKCQNDTLLCEYITFRPYVWDRIGEDVRIFYSHFKGYISNIRMFGADTYPKRTILINEYYWSYLMYRMSLDDEYVDEMNKSFDSGKDVYCWCLLDGSNLEHIYIPEEGDYYTSFFRGIEEVVPDIKKFYIKESMAIHSPGSFVWYDMKNIYNHMGDEKIKMISLDDDILKDGFATRHFCELYIWRFLRFENIQEQTFINNMRKQFSSIRNSSYTQMYCSKKICYKYIKDFDKYIMQNKII
jgi:hypothetical protein